MSRGIRGGCVLAVFVVFTAVALGGIAAGTVVASEHTDNTSLGADISSFMQASSVETADDVEDGTFSVAINRTEDPDERRELIETRQARLEERNDDLRTQREELDEDDDVRSRAIAARISAGSRGLERSANRTQSAAESAGVDAEQIAAIRSNATKLRDPAVTEMAPGLADNPEAELPENARPGADDDEAPGAEGDEVAGVGDEVTGEDDADPNDVEAEGPTPRSNVEKSETADGPAGGEAGPGDGDKGASEAARSGDSNEERGASDAQSDDEANSQDDQRGASDREGDSQSASAQTDGSNGRSAQTDGDEGRSDETDGSNGRSDETDEEDWFRGPGRSYGSLP